MGFVIEQRGQDLIPSARTQKVRVDILSSNPGSVFFISCWEKARFELGTNGSLKMHEGCSAIVGAAPHSVGGLLAGYSKEQQHSQA